MSCRVLSRVLFGKSSASDSIVSRWGVCRSVLCCRAASASRRSSPVWFRSSFTANLCFYELEIGILGFFIPPCPGMASSFRHRKALAGIARRSRPAATRGECYWAHCPLAGPSRRVLLRLERAAEVAAVRRSRYSARGIEPSKPLHASGIFFDRFGGCACPCG